MANKKITKPFTKQELLAKLKALGSLDASTKKSIVCSLIGHSNITEMCFGYVTCARCDAQIGDSLMGIYDNPNQVVVGHNCEICRANYAKMTWRDKYLCPNPSTK